MTYTFQQVEIHKPKEHDGFWNVLEGTDSGPYNIGYVAWNEHENQYCFNCDNDLSFTADQLEELSKFVREVAV
jgi:hypothetical protein